jgi:hypothetical protein
LEIPGTAVPGMITVHFAVDLALTGPVFSVNYACRQAERIGLVRAIPCGMAAFLRGPEKSRILRSGFFALIHRQRNNIIREVFEPWFARLSKQVSSVRS